MAATRIEIIIPEKIFEPGDLVSFEVVVTNLQEFIVNVEPVVRPTGMSFTEMAIIEGQSFSWPASFIMPEGGVTLIAESWLEYYPDFKWHKDSVTKLTLKPGEVAGASRGGFPLGLLVVGGLLGVVILTRKRQ